MRKKIEKGLYLVVDPSMDQSELLEKLRQVVSAGVVAIQVWNNFQSDEHLRTVVQKVQAICRPAGVPVILNDRWQEAIEIGLDGVHFDAIPSDWDEFKDRGADLLVGLTLNNDLDVADWAHANHVDYVSFCSMFPSSTANSCDLVAFDNVKLLAERYAIPVFLAGGIRPDNMTELDGLPYYGIAVVSGVMEASSPADAVAHYTKNLKYQLI